MWERISIPSINTHTHTTDVYIHFVNSPGWLINGGNFHNEEKKKHGEKIEMRKCHKFKYINYTLYDSPIHKSFI